MDTHELANILLKMDKLPVMFQGDDRDGGPFEIAKATQCTAGEDEFPEEFHMPEGFKYVLLGNFQTPLERKIRRDNMQLSNKEILAKAEDKLASINETETFVETCSEAGICQSCGSENLLCTGDEIFGHLVKRCQDCGKEQRIVIRKGFVTNNIW